MKLFFYFFILTTLVKFNFVDSYWWYLGLKSLYALKSKSNNTNSSSNVFSSQDHCDDSKILTSYVQRTLCNTNPKVIQIISEASAMAIQECQFQFKYRRWNCSVFNTTNVYGRLLGLKSREAAFIYAINAAAVMYRVTQACTKGEFSKCGCDQTKKKAIEIDFEWGGCSQNVFFGHKFSRKFADASEIVELRKKRSTDYRLMNLHNNEVGRRTILKNMKQICKCHGVSGSCSMKVCWQVMPDFRVIGDNLIKTFNKASQVSIDRQKMILRVVRKAIKKSEYPNQIRNPNKDDLVYVGRSLNFCEKNLNAGSLGTRGRKCILIPKASLLMLSNSSLPKSDINSLTLTESCSHLCCGRGYRTKIVEIEEDCNCQFQWCCHVKCDKCKRRIIEYYCN